MPNIKRLCMRNCLKLLSVVVIFCTYLAISPTALASDQNERAAFTVKVVGHDLWKNGVKLKDEVSKESNKDKKTIYFPEELEIALRLINK